MGAGLLCLLLSISGCSNEPGSEGFLEKIGAAADQHSQKPRDLDADLEKPVASSTGPWPKFSVDSRNHDFGRMLVGSKKDYTFTIRNEGEAPLELVAGQPTCKCTEFELSASEVAPGESATLFIQWHGKAMSDAFQHGGPIYTNDPKRPSVRFNVEGIVDAPIATLPVNEWDAGIIASTNPVTFEGMVLSYVIPTLTIEEVTTETDLTSFEFEPMTEEELKQNKAMCGYKFHVTVSPGIASGLQKDTLSVVTSEVDDILEIPIQATRVGALRLSPTRGTRYAAKTNRLMLGNFSAAKGRQAELMLVVDQQGVEEEFQLTEIKTVPSSLQVSLEPIGTPTGVVSRYRFKVEVPAGRLRAEHPHENPGSIHCLTNHPSGEEIKLDVVFNSF